MTFVVHFPGTVQTMWRQLWEKLLGLQSHLPFFQRVPACGPLRFVKKRCVWSLQKLQKLRRTKSCRPCGRTPRASEQPTSICWSRQFDSGNCYCFASSKCEWRCYGDWKHCQYFWIFWFSARHTSGPKFKNSVQPEPKLVSTLGWDQQTVTSYHPGCTSLVANPGKSTMAKAQRWYVQIRQPNARLTQWNSLNVEHRRLAKLFISVFAFQRFKLEVSSERWKLRKS